MGVVFDDYVYTRIIYFFTVSHYHNCLPCRYLVSLMQLIQEGEHTHCATRRNWLNMSSHQLFREESNTTNNTNYGIANVNNSSNNNNTTSSATTTSTSKVRWENDHTTPNTTTPSTPVPSAPTATTDASPVPRRSKSAVDYEYNYNNNANNANNGNNGNNGNNYADDYTPPPAGNRPASYSLSQQVNKSSNISPMVSRRLDGGVSTDDFSDNNNNVNSEKQRNMRRLAVPALSERLNALSHLTHAIAAPRPKNINNMQNIYNNANNNTNKPGEFLIDRFLRTLSTQADSGMSVNYANYANNAALSSALAGNNAVSNSTSELYSAAIAADTLEAMAQLVSSSRFDFRILFCCFPFLFPLFVCQ